MRTIAIVACTTLTLSLSSALSPVAVAGQGFEVKVSRISPDLKERMKGQDAPLPG